jgi:drug/metabolite transporter (DMT)-like permease
VLDHQKTLLLTTFGVLLLSPDALVLRWIDADAMHILSWRGLFMAAGLAGLVVLRYRARAVAAVLRCGWTGAGCALSFAVSTVCFVQAIKLAGAASTLMIYSVSPLAAGVLSRLWLRERLALRSLVAIVVCMLGIALILGDDSPTADLTGNLYALAAAVLLAVNFTLARSRAQTDMSPALVPAALLAALIALVLGGPPGLAPTEIGALMVMAGLILPFGLMLVQLGPRRISAAQVSLLLLLEVVLGPLWVWLVLGEAPSIAVLSGGAIVLAALLGHGLIDWREQRGTTGR